MQTYLKTRPAWIQLLMFIGMAFGIFFILSVFGMMILSSLTGIGMSELKNIENWDYNNPNMIYFMRGMLLMQFLGLFVIPSLLYSYFADPAPREYLGLKKPWLPVYWILGIMILVVAIPFVEYLGVLNQKINLDADTQKWMKGMEEDAAKQIQFMLRKHTISELVLNLIFIAVFAGVGEELFFRGILQRIFIRAFKSPWAGIIITAAIFSGFHFQFFGFFPRFALGILLGALYWYSGSLWTAILAHFIYDGLIIVLVYLNPEMIKNPETPMVNPAYLILVATISLAATLYILWQMKRNSATSYAEIYKDDQPPSNQITF